MIESVIVDRSPCVKWDDIAGLENAKQTLLEMVVLPTKRKDIFTGLRRTSRGLLLVGPPGTGKTMLAKAVASESEATFFNVSASSLTSKWIGEGEKLVRTLFMVAISRKPSVIFIDEIDSIMSTRTYSDHGADRRLKSEFLVQFDGVTSNSDDLVIVIGATNKPQELDDAVLRRLVKRIYIPLPDANVRRIFFKHRLKGQEFSLPGGDLERLVRETEGSCDDANQRAWIKDSYYRSKPGEKLKVLGFSECHDCYKTLPSEKQVGRARTMEQEFRI